MTGAKSILDVGFVNIIRNDQTFECIVTGNIELKENHMKYVMELNKAREKNLQEQQEQLGIVEKKNDEVVVEDKKENVEKESSVKEEKTEKKEIKENKKETKTEEKKVSKKEKVEQSEKEEK